MGIFGRKKNDDLTSELMREAAEQRAAHDVQKSAVRNQSTHVKPDADIESLLAAGQLIAAIKLYRERTGVGLAEAKDAVEQMRDMMRRGDMVQMPHSTVGTAHSSTTQASQADVERLIADAQIVAAVKLQRERTGSGLKEAKDAVDAIRIDMRRRGVIR